MANKVDIWMPLYVADYLSATSRLTTEQHGAYLLLLMDYWKNGAPPNNNAVLAQITKLSPDAWSNARTMLEPFFEVSEKQWIQSRVESEMEKANHNKKANIERGKAGAQARWGKKDSPSIVGAMLEQCLTDSSSPSPSPSSSSSSSSNLIGTNVPICPPDGELADKKGKKLPRCNHQAVIDLYHEHLPTMRRIEVWNDQRAGYLRQRWREVASELAQEGEITAKDVLGWWGEFFQHIDKSKFLTGKVNSKDGRAFTADLEWIVRPSNFAKIVEGKYHGNN